MDPMYLLIGGLISAIFAIIISVLQIAQRNNYNVTKTKSNQRLNPSKKNRFHQT